LEAKNEKDIFISFFISFLFRFFYFYFSDLGRTVRGGYQDSPLFCRSWFHSCSDSPRVTARLAASKSAIVYVRRGRGVEMVV
jgi:hypothetical protein